MTASTTFSAARRRIAAHATILIERELPEGVVLVDDPSATSVVFARGVPSTVNTPALDPALMYDMRDPDLQDQASGAIDRHAQAHRPAHGATTRRDRRVSADGQPVLFEQGAEGLRGRRPGARLPEGTNGVRETRARVLRRCALEPAEQEGGRVRSVTAGPC